MKTLILAIVPLSILSGAVFAQSDGPPTFNVEPSCQAAAAAAGNQERLKACLDSEQKAHEQLASEWTQFTPSMPGCRSTASPA